MSRLMTVLVLFLIAASLPMAHATPVDETWIPGLYDNGDSDAAILALTSLVAVANIDVAPASSPLLPRTRVRATDATKARPAPCPALQNRAPPAA
jgi:hypothetical protein